MAPSITVEARATNIWVGEGALTSLCVWVYLLIFLKEVSYTPVNSFSLLLLVQFHVLLSSEINHFLFILSNALQF